jgi:hypothetical protein
MLQIAYLSLYGLEGKQGGICMTLDARDNISAVDRGDAAVGVVVFGVAGDGTERRVGGCWSKGGVMCPGCLGKGGAMVERIATVGVVGWGDMAEDGDVA